MFLLRPNPRSAKGAPKVWRKAGRVFSLAKVAASNGARAGTCYCPLWIKAAPIFITPGRRIETGLNDDARLAFVPHPTEGVVRLYVGIRRPVSRQSSSPVDPAEYPARAAGQWIPPSIPPEQLANGSRPVSRQSGSPVPSIPPEQPAIGSRRVSRQSSWPVDPAEYPARAARRWIPPSIPPERLASGSLQVSRQSSSPVDPAKYPTRAARQWIPPSIPLSIPVPFAGGSCRVSCQYEARAARQHSPRQSGFA